MTKQIYEQAYYEAFRNAEQYAKDAEKLIELKSYGHALAFCMLGGEELIKAIVYFLISRDIIPKEDANLVQEEITSRPEAHHIKLLLHQTLSVTTIEEVKRFISKKAEIREKMKKLIKKRKGFPEVQERQKMKLKGFYVDIKDGKLTSPFHITEEKATEELTTLEKDIDNFKKYQAIIDANPLARKILKSIYEKGLKIEKWGV